MIESNKSEKKLDKVSIFGALVCVAILGLLLWSNSNAAKNEAQAKPATTATSAVQTAQPAAATPLAVTSEEAATTVEDATFDLSPLKLTKADEFDANFDALGGGISNVAMLKYTVQTENPEEADDLVILGDNAQHFVRLDTCGINLLQNAAPVQSDNSITLTRRTANGSLVYIENWTVVPDMDYEVKYTLQVKNDGDAAVHVNKMLLDCGELPAFLSRQKQTYLSGNAGFVAYGVVGKEKAVSLLEKNISKLNSKPEKREALATTPASWVAVSSKYFMFALRHPRMTIRDAMGSEQLLATSFAGVNAAIDRPIMNGESTDHFHGQAWLPDFTLNPGDTAIFTSTAYAGPKNYIRLQDMGEGIDSIMGMNLFFFWNFAWMGWISRALLAALVWFAGLFGVEAGYGIGIILVTICVKVIFMPLSYRGTTSMRKMQAIQPQIKELRARFKDDPQRMYHEQQKLFKENNVSQMGGCLPMLLQIPVFFAMFNTFRSAIEIRNASFLWISDLSMPDDVCAIFGLPIRPLALLTGITMLFQQKLTPSADPNQAKMMTIMSLVFVVFFYNMPAALTLYMTVNQLISIVQMLIFRKLDAKKA